MATLAEVTENERIIERHLHYIHPLLDYDACESQSYQHYMALVLDSDFNIMQQSHGLFGDS